MGTSLAEQLKKLAVPQTSILLQDKKRASLLFDPKEAANFDRETVYELGLNGLEELKKLDPRFDQFENTLFSPLSRGLERSVESTEANKKLDKDIQRFIFLLSPYFLLKCAHQALEWLIMRFHIHQFNVDDLLMLILPYHETRMFVRVLQLLDVKDPVNRWHWLRPLQKPGVPLSKIALLNHCASDNSFLHFVCKMTLLAVKVHGKNSNSLSTLFSFSCTTIMGALEHSKTVSEVQVTHILELLLKGITHNAVDFAASSLLITAQLARKAHLSQHFLFEIINKMSKISHDRLQIECVTLLVLLYQTQHETLTSFPEKALMRLSKSSTFTSSLYFVASSGGYISPLLIPLISTTLKNIQLQVEEAEELKGFARRLIEQIVLDNKSAENFIRTAIEAFDVDIVETAGKKENSNENNMEWYSSFLCQLERQYALVFDLVALQALKSAKSSKQRKALRSVLGFVPRIAHDQGNIDVYEKLRHVDEDIRVQAIKYFVSNFSKLKEKDKELLVEGLKERLCDDSPKVIHAVLKFQPSDLASLVGEDFLIEQLISLARRFWYIRNDHIPVTKRILSCLCSDLVSMKTEMDASILMAVMPYLLPVKAHEIQYASTVVNSLYGQQNSFLKALDKELGDLNYISKTAPIYQAVFKKMTDNQLLPSFENLIPLFTSPQIKNEAVYKFLSTLFLTTVASHEDPDQIWKVLDLILGYTNSSEQTALVKGSAVLCPEVIPDCLAVVAEKKFPLQALLYSLSTLMKHIVLPEEVKKQVWWELTAFNDNSKKTPTLLLTRIFEILIKGCGSSKQQRNAYVSVLKEFFEVHFPSFQSRINFLSNLWVIHELQGTVDYELQLRSLLLAKSLLQQCDVSKGWIVNFENKVVIPALLVATSCPLASVRRAALECFSVIMTSFGVNLDENSYIHLVGEILEKEEELKLDAEQLPVVLYTLLSPDHAVRSLINPSRRPFMNKTLDAILQCVLDEGTPIYVCAALLRSLTFVNSTTILLKLIPLGQRMLLWSERQDNQMDRDRSAVFRNILSRLNEDTANALQNKEGWTFFKSVLGNYHTLVFSEDGKITCPAVLAMEKITKEVFDCVPAQQQEILALLVEVGTESDSPDVVSAVGRVFKKIMLSSELVVLELEKMRNCTDKMTPPANVQRRRKSLYEPPSLNLLKAVAWRRGITLLELIQNKKKLHSVHLLLPVLSGILQRCLEFDQQAPVEYTKQLVLSCILHCCQKLSSNDSPSKMEGVDLTNALNVELVVKCIQGTQNPQTHHHALLVLSQMAGMVPEHLLTNIMEIFTFMGSCVLRQDDGYSFQVISKIIETIIPIIVRAKDQGIQSSQLYSVAASVLRVFADALLHVPEYRRLALYYKLMNIMEARSFLWLFICLVLEGQVRVGSKDQAKRVELLVDITLKFPPSTVIQNCIYVLEYVRTLPSDKDESGKWEQELAANIQLMSKTVSALAITELFDVKRYTAKQLRHFRYIVTTYLCVLLSSHTFINQVAELNEDDTREMEGLYRNLIENVLHYIQSTSREVEISRNGPSAKYWKVMLHQGFDILDKVNALLPSDMFLLVVQGLLDNEMPTVRRKVMELLNAQLMQQEYFINCRHEDLLALVSPLMKIITDFSDSADHQLNQQTALISIRLLARLLASENSEQFKKILKILTKLARSETAEGNILASLVLSIAELCSSLRAFAISSLPKVMPTLLKILHVDQITESQDMLLLSSVSAIYKIVENLPHFMSPYLETLLWEVSVLSSMVQQESENQKLVPVMQKLKAIRQKLSGLIPPRVLIPSVGKCYSQLIEKEKFAALGPLMEILADSFSAISGPEINQFLPDLTTFFLSALQFRTDSSNTDVSAESVLAAEGHIIQALVALVFKLSESSFRPLYYNLFHWATSLELHKVRVITFYRLSSGIAEGLKGLFVLFAGHFVKNAASMLDQNNISKSETLYFGSGEAAESKSLLLVEYVLKTLHNVFLHDSHHFLTKERFDTLMQPLVDQLENTLGGVDALRLRATSLLTPCLGQFAVDAADDLLWKQLNYQILLKTRHNSSHVRLVALETVCEMARKLGEDFLPLLPETVPFLAELLEDEDEAVEKACHKAVQELEEVLGEPLKKYF
ncbi:HEAT repeat-containing protein 1 [Anabrus simplex]|uniref:HEAT repeat-containing protein 1 n=1 Tax=Anabrus simplex TaxID=316456 RepID=UPI0035A27659